MLVTTKAAQLIARVNGVRLGKPSTKTGMSDAI
jgi:hypothetical protein